MVHVACLYAFVEIVVDSHRYRRADGSSLFREGGEWNV